MPLVLKKSLKWFFAIIFGLPLCVYIALMVINIGDQDLSPSASHKYKAIKNLAVNARDDNAYIYALGFSTETPVIKGREVAQRIITNDSDRAGVASSKNEFENIAIKNSVELAQTCFRQDKKFCKINNKLDSYYYKSTEAKQLIADNKKFIAHYQQLISLAIWREVGVDTKSNLPYYDIMQAQRLYLMAVLQQLETVDVQTTKNQLEMDIRFWRMTLSETYTLQTKMIAKAAIERHFLIVQQVLSKLTMKQAFALVPDSWLLEISNTERDFTKAFIGEWGFQHKFWQNYRIYAASDLLGRIEYLAFSSFFKTNNSLNLSARSNDVHVEYSNLPYQSMQSEISNFDKKSRDHCQTETNVLSLLYNPAGKILSCIPQPTFVDYVIRVSDLEGVRRLVLLSFELDFQQFSAEQVNTIVLNSEYKNPYTEQVFNFDASKKLLIFAGFKSKPFSSDKVSIAL